MMHRYLLAALALTAAATDSEAGPFRRHAQPAYQSSYQPVYQSPTYLPPTVTPAGEYVTSYTPSAAPAGEYTSGYTPVVTAGYPVASSAQAGSFTGDGLDEVNAKRAARGLRPFVRDEGLTQAAYAAAQFRATHRLFGHTGNDFAFCPPGVAAASNGCAAYPASFGWMSCCVYDNYTYAGAAWVTGSDGQRYMHLFVR